MKFQPCFLAKKRPSGDRKRGQPTPPQKGGLPLPFFRPKTENFSQFSLFESKNTFFGAIVVNRATKTLRYNWTPIRQIINFR